MNDIEKYFKVSSWVVYRNNTKVLKPYLSLIRCIFRDMNINFTCSLCKIKDEENGKYINTTSYIIHNL